MCGVIGVSGIEDAAHLAHLGLYALQHRGQESAGIVAVGSDGVPHVKRGMGLVVDAVPEASLNGLAGDVAVGHTRYSTAGQSLLANAQPYLVKYHSGWLSVAHNGNIVNAKALREELVQSGAIFSSTSDTEVIIHLIARSHAPTVEGQIRQAMERLEGAYTVVIGVGRTLYVIVDSRGFRPMVVGKLGNGLVAASETCALDLLNAEFVRELQPGDFVRIEDGRMTDLHRLSPRRVSRCIFELVYFARPDSNIFGVSVDKVRRELGRQIGRHHAVPGADLVLSVPDSANVMALGYSEVTGTKLEHALIRNHYVGRTFITPTQAARVNKVRIKFNPVKEVIRGKKVVLVDDSLVRGTTSKGLVTMVRQAGAKEIHFRLGSPPVTGPCYYGIDLPSRKELIAANHSVEEIRQYLGVDSLEYITLDEMIEATGNQTSWCHACFSGDYPTPSQLTFNQWQTGMSEEGKV